MTTQDHDEDVYDANHSKLVLTRGRSVSVTKWKDEGVLTKRQTRKGKGVLAMAAGRSTRRRL